MRNKKPMITIIYLFIFASIIYLSLYAHEVTHRTIFEYHDIEAEIEFDYGIIPMRCVGNGNCNDVCQLSQNINEIVSYNLFALELIIGSGLLVIICILEVRFLIGDNSIKSIRH